MTPCVRTGLTLATQLFAAALAGCGGYAGTDALAETDAGGPGGTGGTGGTGGGDPIDDCEELFAQRVQLRLQFCRTYHITDGVADVDGGDRFLLSSDPAQDFALLQESWERLGGDGNGPSEILAGLGYAGAVPVTDPDPAAADKRFIYDTRTLGNGNTGHAFTDVLTETERKAILEYLKTL